MRKLNKHTWLLDTPRSLRVYTRARNRDRALTAAAEHLASDVLAEDWRAVARPPKVLPAGPWWSADIYTAKLE